GITPDNSTISTQGPTTEAAYADARGMKVKYSFANVSTSDWGGGWGATLANTLNLTGMNNIKLFLKWDGSSNDYNVVLKDSDGTAVKAIMSSSGLSTASFNEISIATSEFSYSADSSDSGANTSFNWSSVTNYNIVYNTKNTSASYQNLDNIMATYIDQSTPYLTVSSTGVSFSTYIGGTTTSPSSNTVTISNSSAGSSDMAYTATCATSWVTLSSASGTLAGGASTNLAVSINLANAPTTAGTYYATVEVASATAQNSPQLITVTLIVRELSGSDPSIDTISESAAPAGTRIILTGTSFGESQGASTITFTKDGAATVAQVLSWSDGAIEVEVPYTLSEGNYTLSINKLTIAAEGINVLSQSDAKTFQVTAASTAGIATIWPNPFNPRVETNTIQYNAGTATNISINIYDSTARVVKHSLVTGVNQVTWDGKNSAGEIVGDGLYLVRIINEDSKALIAKGKILVVKR
ncbi:MAG: T9SS type A sorting domain-containing protein, partial [Candidatus Margulisiibacteriota bacterium]